MRRKQEDVCEEDEQHEAPISDSIELEHPIPSKHSIVESVESTLTKTSEIENRTKNEESFSAEDKSIDDEETNVSEEEEKNTLPVPDDANNSEENRDVITIQDSSSVEVEKQPPTSVDDEIATNEEQKIESVDGKKEDNIKQKEERGAEKPLTDATEDSEKANVISSADTESEENVKNDKPVEQETEIVSNELKYMVKEYDVLSSENSNLREMVAKLEREKNECVEQHSKEKSQLKVLATRALVTLKEEKFSKDISKEAVQELEKSVLQLEKKISEKNGSITTMKQELEKYQKEEIQKLEDMSESPEEVAYDTTDEEEK